MILRFSCIVALLGFLLSSINSVAQRTVDNIETQVTKAVFLGKTIPVRDAILQESSPEHLLQKYKATKMKPYNFKNRGYSRVVLPEIEHQGADKLRQTSFQKSSSTIEPLVNVNGLGTRSPNDPTGDIGLDYYVQAINATPVAVFEKDGTQVGQFSMNTLWTQLGESSRGDPIILFDEIEEKWILTEFTGPAKLLVAVSETSDPLGSYYAYSFTTPNFPDYPKYALWPNALYVTTNEGGGGVLHQYFIDRAALMSGSEDVTIQRVAISGETNTEQGFYVSTPVDWNGKLFPESPNPMVMRLNDSSWGDSPEDAVELYEFIIDWDDPDNTTVENLRIPLSPYDGYPCSESGFGFQCVPQLGGDGLDAIPEVIMNLPFYMNYGSHESIVFNFVTDVTNGQNLSGIRWVELRKTPGADWELYQEGTFAPDDGQDRYMGSIAMDKFGNIAMGYNVSSDTSYVGVRYTGRYASDPLGVMTVPECHAVNGSNTINANGRFGDYSQMSLDPVNGSTFWFTTEYAAGGGSRTRVLAFELGKDTFDLGVRSILNPTSRSGLTDQEIVEIEVANNGLMTMVDYSLGLSVNGVFIEEVSIDQPLLSDSIYTHSFSMGADLSEIKEHNIEVYVNHPDDRNPFNDTINTNIFHQALRDGILQMDLDSLICTNEIPITFNIVNNGEERITRVDVELTFNGSIIDTLVRFPSIGFGEDYSFNYNIDDFMPGQNLIESKLIAVNEMEDLFFADNEDSKTVTTIDAEGQHFLVLITDNAPEETTWEIRSNATGQLIFEGGPYEDAGSIEVINLCLPTQECYTLTIFDSAGDGICCGNGNGSYVLRNPNGINIINGSGIFGAESSHVFCPGVECMVTATFDITQPSFSGASDGSILITAENGQAPYNYSIDGGANYVDTPLFENLPEGDYDIEVLSGDGFCSYAESIVLETTSSAFDLEGITQWLVKPNPNDGYFQVVVSNITSSDQRLPLQVLDHTGRVLFEREMAKYNNEFYLPISLVSFPAGNYFLRLPTEQSSGLFKVVKL